MMECPVCKKGMEKCLISEDEAVWMCEDESVSIAGGADREGSLTSVHILWIES